MNKATSQILWIKAASRLQCRVNFAWWYQELTVPLESGEAQEGQNLRSEKRGRAKRGREDSGANQPEPESALREV